MPCPAASAVMPDQFEVVHEASLVVRFERALGNMLQAVRVMIAGSAAMAATIGVAAIAAVISGYRASALAVVPALATVAAIGDTGRGAGYALDDRFAKVEKVE